MNNEDNILHNMLHSKQLKFSLGTVDREDLIEFFYPFASDDLKFYVRNLPNNLMREILNDIREGLDEHIRQVARDVIEEWFQDYKNYKEGNY